MKGVRYLTDENNRKKAVDGIIAESRKEDTKIPIEKVLKKLKKECKIK